MRDMLFDTNVLIGLSDPSHACFAYVERAIRSGVRASTSSVAWHEYVRGPLTDLDRSRVLRILESRVLPLDRRSAERAAELYNATGRRRGSTADCLIAAIAIEHELELVTLNTRDFHLFEPMNLVLANMLSS